MSLENVRYEHVVFPISSDDSVELLPGDTIKLLLDKTNNTQDIDQMVIVFHNKAEDSLSCYKLSTDTNTDALGLLEWGKITLHRIIVDELECEFYDEEDEEYEEYVSE